MSSRLVSSRLRHLPGTVCVLVRMTVCDELAFVLPRAPDVQALRKLRMVMAIWKERLRSNGSKAPRRRWRSRLSQGSGARAMLQFCRESELGLPGRYEYQSTSTLCAETHLPLPPQRSYPPWKSLRTGYLVICTETCGCTFPRDLTVAVNTMSSVTYDKP